MRKRILSALMAITLSISLVPTSVWASSMTAGEIEIFDNQEPAGNDRAESKEETIEEVEAVEQLEMMPEDMESAESDEGSSEEMNFIDLEGDVSEKEGTAKVEITELPLEETSDEAINDSSSEDKADSEKLEQVEVVEFAKLPEDVAFQQIESGSLEDEIVLPTVINATVLVDESKNSVEIDGISWKKSTEKSDSETLSEQLDCIKYVYEPVLPEKYYVSDKVVIPKIVVVVEGLEELEIPQLVGEPRNEEGFIAPVDDPDASAIKITTAKELAEIANDLYGSYVLENDIDLSAYGTWSPIGKTLATAFHGKLDGQGHTINGLSVSVSFDSGNLIQPNYAVGLFGVCDGAQIKNLFLRDVNVSIKTTSGYYYDNSIIDSEGTVFAGAIVGYARNSSVIYNCIASGKVSSSASGEGYSPTVAGGLIGYANTAIISYSYNLSEVTSYNANATTAKNAYAGGLLGRAEVECIIDKSYNSGIVSARTLDYGDSFAGGLVADTSASKTTITNAFNEGNVQSVSGNNFSDSAYAGGIAAAFQGKIDKVYNCGTVIAQAKDPYGINNTTAYAGGICANSETSSTISNSAIVQQTVSSSASGVKKQYRISNSGAKTNNITIDSVTSGSVNDADYSKSLESLMTADEYVNTLGWDFSGTWEIVEGKQFPQLKQVNTESEEYNQEYVDQHLAFISNGAYSNILNNYRWAQIYWSEENNFKSNLGGALYEVTDKLVNLATLDFGALFDEGNPFNCILADYVSDQTVEESVIQLYKVELPFEIDKKCKKVRKVIEKNWKDNWGELSDEDLFWLFHYEERSSEEWINSNFEEHISEIVADTRNSGSGWEEVLGIKNEVFDKVYEQKDNYNNIIDWFNGLITYSGHVSAYVNADEEFKCILEEMCNNLPASNPAEIKYKVQLWSALKSYTQYNDSDSLTAQMFANYLLDGRIAAFEDTIKKTINKKVSEWVKASFSATAQSTLSTIGWTAEKTWKIVEYVTKNGELQNCREMLKANAYFEDTMYHTLLAIESRFRGTSNFNNACLFDAAFKFFKETEICSMDIVIEYLRTYQASWLQAIRNMSNTFMNSAIEEVQINKLFLYNTYCHGTSYVLGGKVITIACPTNVFVYDERGELVAAIENNEVTYCADNILTYTADAVKLVTVPTNQNYSIRISSTADGFMSYSVSEYNQEKENVQTTVYANVSISEGDSFTGTINNEIDTDSQSYDLTNKDGTVIDEYVCVKESTNVPVTNISIENPVEVMSIGESIALTANIMPENASNKSVAWCSSDSSIIAVSETGKLTALKEGTAIISASSIYGGVTDSSEIIVLSDEQTLLIKKQPIGGTYVLGEQAEPLIIEWYEKNNEEVSFQWYEADEENAEGRIIEGAVQPSYVPPTASVGTKYYYVKVSNGIKSIESERACVNVILEPLLASGMLSENVEWELTESLILKISGSGEISCSSTEEVPWREYTQSIKSVEVSEGITEIDVNALADMGQLQMLSLPKSLTSIPAGALSGCNALTELIIPFVGTDRNKANDENAVFGAIFGKTSSDGTAQYYSVSGTSMSGYYYDIPKTLRKVTIVDAVQIPFGAFYNCSTIQEISLNKEIASIGEYAFRYCSALKTVDTPDGTTSIGKNAFEGCTSLTDAVLGENIATIGESVFAGCDSIENLTVPFIGANRNAKDSKNAVFGYLFGPAENGVAQYYSISGSSLSGVRLAIPESLKKVIITNADHIPFGAFSNCTNLTSIVLNEGVEEINGYAFYNCTGLTGIIIPDSVSAIAEYALNKCNSLEEITLPFVGGNRTVSGTYDGAFGYIFGRSSEADNNYYVQYSILEGTSLSGYGYAVPTALKKVVITDTKQIPVGAFSNLIELESVTITPKVTKIGDYAFYEATGLTDIYYDDWESEWNKIEVGSGNEVLDSVTIHYLEEPSKIYGASLRLTGDIGVNFYYEFKNSLINDPNAGINIKVGDGKVKKISLNDAEVDTKSVPGKTLYKFTCYVAAKQMKDIIEINAVATNYEEEAHYYSIRKYADNIISKEKYSDELKYLVRVMMYYGASSQRYLKYNTLSLANEGMEMEDIVSAGNDLSAEDLEAYMSQKSDMPEGLTLYGANLSLKSETVLRYHFTINEGHDISEYTFTINGKKYTPVNVSGRYCIEINNIRAQDLDVMFTVIVKDMAGNEGYVTYGPLTYVRNIIKAGRSKYSQELIDTVRSLYLYNKAAESYLATKS